MITSSSTSSKQLGLLAAAGVSHAGMVLFPLPFPLLPGEFPLPLVSSSSVSSWQLGLLAAAGVSHAGMVLFPLPFPLLPGEFPLPLVSSSSVSSWQLGLLAAAGVSHAGDTGKTAIVSSSSRSKQFGLLVAAGVEQATTSPANELSASPGTVVVVEVAGTVVVGDVGLVTTSTSVDSEVVEVIASSSIERVESETGA